MERYAFADAGRILQVRSQTVANWFRGYTRQGKDYPPLFLVSASGPFVRDRISYIELIEAKVVSAWRQHGISAQRIRRAREFAKVHLDIEFPFATRQFKTDGSRVLYEFERNEADTPKGPLFVDIGNAAGQTVFPGYLRDVVELFEFTPERGDWPIFFYPRGRDVPLTIDPMFRAGQVTVSNRGITVDTILKRLQVEESKSFIAQDLRIDEAVVDAVIACW